MRLRFLIVPVATSLALFPACESDGPRPQEIVQPTEIAEEDSPRAAPTSPRARCEPLPARRVNQVDVYLLPEDESPYDRSSFVPRVRQLSGDQVNYPIRATLKYLLAGPTASEDALGCDGMERMTGVIRSLELSDGSLTIDLHDITQEHGWISTSYGGGVFQGQFALTLAQFEEIDRVLFEIEGSCKTFYRFVQTGICQPTDLAKWR